VSSRIRYSTSYKPLVIAPCPHVHFLIDVSQGYVTTRNTPLTTPNTSPVKPVPNNPQNAPISTPSIFRTPQDDLRDAASTVAITSPTIAPPRFSASPTKRTRAGDSDEEAEADALVGLVENDTAALVGQSALNEADVPVYDNVRVMRPLPTRKFKQGSAATTLGLKNVTAAATTLDENGEVNPFASTC
jgi:hypothetical protein